MNGLRRKYGYNDEPEVSRTIRQEMDLLNIPDYIRKTIDKCLKEQNKDDSYQIKSHSLLLEQQASDGQGSCYNIVSDDKDLTEEQLCFKYGLDPEQLRSQFKDLVPNVLNILHFFQTGFTNVLKENLNPAKLLGDDSLGETFNDHDTWELSKILKMLTILHHNFSSSILFSNISLLF